MNESESMKREEIALDDFIKSTEHVVAVCLGEAFHPGAQIMQERIQNLQRSIPDLQVVNISREAYRNWADKNTAYGTPNLLIFRDGKLKRRVPGVVSFEKLYEYLQEI